MSTKPNITTVVSRQTPSRPDTRLSLCESHDEITWLHPQTGEEYCQVSMGRHRGTCDICEGEPVFAREKPTERRWTSDKLDAIVEYE